MEARTADLKKDVDDLQQGHKSRFQIVKLEERTAPRFHYHHYTYPGWNKHGYSGPPGQVK